ncbi:fumarylacetoacetate hydrolase family protein [Rhodophyticola porphyridii]|uniref:FAA hydrolase family protein n=1 Tax=Rhodophyticola porphyridii TaxID=1852017 RepID=A0A3L9Y8P7_9RHOB|nr:fumarylacetoacetate hydrolase family protein [Rhodophyticola porphyridii]RMA43658.1 FAA hydrolase family protein [Rhodophyticola porphyridii]
MKFMRIGAVGAETPAVLDENGIARDLSEIVSDIGPETLPYLETRMAPLTLSDLPEVPIHGARIGAPFARPRNVWCIGLNYSDHAAEAGMPVPTEPILFTKSGSTVCGPNDPILKSPSMTKLDWEVELGVVIGKAALEIGPDAAMDHVFGYTVVNDVSERAWQLERGGQWSKGKGYPHFCPAGPLLVTRDELGDPGDLAMRLSVNGQTFQNGSTRTMIFPVAEIVHYLSQFCLLEPGDLICTGTPPGVGMGQSPQRYLDIGDEVVLSVSGLGEQKQTVIASEKRS